MDRSHYDQIVSEAADVFAVKNAEYGNSIEAEGLIGSAYHLRGLAVRLGALVVRANDLEIDAKYSDVANVYIDMINYAVIGYHMLQNGNWRGVEDDLETDDQ